MTKLLITEPPLQVLPTLAEYVGLNEAIFLQQLHYLMHYSRMGPERRYIENEGTPFEVIWVKNTMLGSFKEGEKIENGWVDEFSWCSEATIKKTFTNLIKDELVIWSDGFNKYGKDRTRWYTIDYDKLEALNEPVKRIISKNGKRVRAASKGRRSQKNSSMSHLATLSENGSIAQDATLSENGSIAQDATLISKAQDATLHAIAQDATLISTKNGLHESKSHDITNDDKESEILNSGVVPDIGLCSDDVTPEGVAVSSESEQEQVIEGVNLDKPLLNGDKGEVWGQIQSAFDALGQWRNFISLKSSPLYGATDSPLDNSQAVRCEGDTLVVAVYQPNAASALQQGRLGLTLAQLADQQRAGLKLSFEQSL